MRFVKVLVFFAGMGMLSANFAIAQPGAPKTQKVAVQPNLSLQEIPKGDSIFSACFLNRTIPMQKVAAIWRESTLHIRLEGAAEGRTYALEIVIEGDQFASRLYVSEGQGSLRVEATDQLMVTNCKPEAKAKGMDVFLNFRGTASLASGTEWSEKNDWVDSKFTVSGPLRLRW